MKVAIVGNNNAAAEELLKKAGFEITADNPEFIVSYGGDGTFMKSEFAHPGVPKIVLKDSAICKVCSVFPNEEVLAKVKAGSYDIRELIKLGITAHGKTLTAMNDIIVHNNDPRHGIRYQIWADERQFGETIIGDGVVVATPFGSTAYYRSITDSFFETGLGLAFNNSTEQMDHVVLDDAKTIKIKITRGEVGVYADNQAEHLTLKEGDEVIIKKSAAVAR